MSERSHQLLLFNGSFENDGKSGPTWLLISLAIPPREEIEMKDQIKLNSNGSEGDYNLHVGNQNLSIVVFLMMIAICHLKKRLILELYSYREQYR